MKQISSFKVQQLCLLGKPKCDRALYRLIKKNRVRSIIEFGLADTERTVNLIRVAQRFCGSGQVRYTGIDLFESGSDAKPGLELIKVHQMLSKLAAKIQLVPGTIDQAIPRIANSHLRTDLIVVSSCYEKEQLNECWSFLPRMLCATSVMMLQSQGDDQAPFQPLTRMAIERIAKRFAQPAKTMATDHAAA